MAQEKTGLVDYLYILVKWRKLIIINFFVVCFIAAGVSLILPKWYSGNTTIMPPEEEKIGVSSLLNKIPLGGLGLGSVSEQTNVFLAIINSRTVMEAVAKKFDLAKRYKTKNMEETVRVLRRRISIKINEEGTITLSVEASTPYFSTNEEENEARKLAKDMANFFIEELDGVNKHLKVQRAKNTRIFIEKRYLQNLKDLHRAEEKFKQFQQKYGAIALPAQTTATISAAAELKAQIIVKEVELGVLQKYFSSSHNNVIKAKNELDELNRKYNEFKYGKKEKAVLKDNSNDSKDVFLPLEKVPDMELQYARLFREVTLQEKILEFLLPQYEEAKIEEAKDTPTVQVLDKAVTPIKRTKPKRMIMVLFTGFLSLIMSIFLVFIFEYWQRVQTEKGQEYEKISLALSLLKRDFHLKSKNR